MKRKKPINTGIALSTFIIILVAIFSAILPASAVPTVSEKGDRIVLRCDALAIALDKSKNGAIVSMVNNRTKRELVAPDAESPLFRLTFTRKGDNSGETVVVDNMEAKRVAYETSSDENKATAILNFSELGDKKIEAQCIALLSEPRRTVNSSPPETGGQVGDASTHSPDLWLRSSAATTIRKEVYTRQAGMGKATRSV
jgi:hypothetical protein